MTTTPSNPPAARKLVTPIYLKSSPDQWADDPVFYLLTASGLHLCRNHKWWRSCVPVGDWPGELDPQEPFLKLRLPRIPRSVIETVVGFFDRIAMQHDAEAAVVLAYNNQENRVEVIVPPQTSYVHLTWSGMRWPMNVEYEIPPLAPGLTLMGDIHSHVDGAAYASFTDREDEKFRSGLHIVVGEISKEPPQWHIDFLCDGMRFKIADPKMVMDYKRRRHREVPPEWIAKVQVKCSKPAVFHQSSSCGHSSGTGQDTRALPASADTAASPTTITVIPEILGPDPTDAPNAKAGS